MLVGPAGSGKSTKAIELNKSLGFERISQDDMGKDGHIKKFLFCLANKDDIVVDRMNFDKAQRNRYIKPAKDAGYEIEIVVFHVPRATCFDRIMARENHPTINGNKATTGYRGQSYNQNTKEMLDKYRLEEKTKEANSALDTFFTKYERVEDTEADKVTRLGWQGNFGHPDLKPSAIICDLDGTLCNIDHRLHYVQNEDKKKRRWDLFNKTIPDDKLNGWCLNILNQMNVEDFFHNISNQIVLCSGRVDSSKKDTVDWLTKHNVPYQHLFMRHRSDFRDDTIVKEIMLEFEIKPRYNIMFSIDDRPKVCRMWRKHGIVCLQVNDKEF